MSATEGEVDDDLVVLGLEDAELGTLTLIVTTPTGVFVRRVPQASPLPPSPRQGDAAENATRDAASKWGLADFVFRGGQRPTASGQRELGDGLIVVGDLGLIVQVKSRVELTDDREKERNWIDKHTGKALRQCYGTARNLRRGPATLTNARGREVTISGPDVTWMALVVLDHPSPPPDLTPPAYAKNVPAVVLLRRDWDFLFEHLRSTRSVVAYLHRCAGEQQPLGQEPLRYYQLADLDEQAEPGPVNAQMLAAPNARSHSTPLLPKAPAGHDDTWAHGLYKYILEEIAASPMQTGDENGRLRILAAIDCLPPAERAAFSSQLMTNLKQVMAEGNGQPAWQAQRIVFPDVQLTFAACSRPAGDADARMLLRSYLELRHHEFQSAEPGRDDLVSVVVMLTPNVAGERAWDTTVAAFAGKVELSDEDVTMLRTFWDVKA